MIWGLSESKWKELKDQQREYNMRKSKMLDLLDVYINPYETKKADFEITKEDYMECCEKEMKRNLCQ